MNKPDWPSPTDLRCVGGPADGQWFAVPPEGYVHVEHRGGAAWQWLWLHERQTASQWLTWQADAPPRSALPGESV